MPIYEFYCKDCHTIFNFFSRSVNVAKETDNMNEDDPRQAADLMRKLTDMTGLELGPGMQEALSRMERGEDPDRIEAEMGDLLEGEDPFVLPGKKGRAKGGRRFEPFRDETLYDL